MLPIYSMRYSFRMYVCYDTETSFLRKGFTRKDSCLFEIGAHSKDATFQRMVNPLKIYDNADNIIESIYQSGSDPNKSLMFWVKLLSEKGALRSNLRRADKWKQADAIGILLRRSDTALKHESPLKMLYALEKTDDDVKLAENMIKHKTMLGKPNGLLFYTPESAMREMKEKFEKEIWVAHNGKSFDEKIVKNQGVDLSKVSFVDSLPLFRTLVPGENSYSQPLLYRSVLKREYKAHHAYSDSKALHELLTHVLKDRSLESISTKKAKKKITPKPKTDLLEIRGIGPVSATRLMRKKIKSIDDLNTYIDTHNYNDWCTEFSDIHCYKKLGEKLFALDS
jgi:DNA polymerase III epsilon subunit-like protein